MKAIKSYINRVALITLYLLMLVYSQCSYAGIEENILFVKVDKGTEWVGTGTAFIVGINKERYIVTSHHVVKNAAIDPGAPAKNSI